MFSLIASEKLGEAHLVRTLLFFDLGVMESSGLWRRLRAMVRPPPLHPCGQALLSAAARGDVATVKEYLERGAPPDQVRTAQGETALWVAVREGHRPVVDALLAAGADPAAEDLKGASALTQAAAYGRVDIVKKIFRARPIAFHSKSAALGLRRAALNGSRGAVRAMLQGGVSPNARPRKLPPALHAAAAADVGCLAELLTAGADVNLRDGEGLTALHWAVQSNQERCVRLLLSCGADRNARDKLGRLPASGAWDEEMRRLLQPTPPPRRHDDDSDDDAAGPRRPRRARSPERRCILS